MSGISVFHTCILQAVYIFHTFVLMVIQEVGGKFEYIPTWEIGEPYKPSHLLCYRSYLDVSVNRQVCLSPHSSQGHVSFAWCKRQSCLKAVQGHLPFFSTWTIHKAREEHYRVAWWSIWCDIVFTNAHCRKLCFSTPLLVRFYLLALLWMRNLYWKQSL